ncbi:hypothetical protein Hanom_Chr05g00408361 [Helianthus anomalus]
MKQFVDDLLDLTEVDDDLLKRSICEAHAKDVDDSLQMIHCLCGLSRLCLSDAVGFSFRSLVSLLKFASGRWFSFV